MAEAQESENCVVIYNGLNEHTLSGDAKTRLRLVPGANIVSIKELNNIKEKNEAFEHLEEIGQIDVIQSGALKKDPKTGEDIIEIPKMSAKSIKAVVEAVDDQAVLKGYLDQELKANAPKGRPTVVKMIKDQMQALVDAENAPTGGDDE